MVIGTTLLIIAVIVIGILFLFSFRHKFIAILLIGLLLLGFFSFNAAFKGRDISLNNISDVGKIAKVYLSWLGTAFGNIKTLTGQAVKMNWSLNQTEKAT